MKLLIVAGEPSGDIHAANLIVALQKQSPGIELIGMGGQAMREAGANILFDITDTDIVGFTEAISHLKKLKKLFQSLLSLIDREKPDGAILIDYPGFNLRLGTRAKKKGIKVIYYISPQVWAWGKRRIKEIASSVDKMIVVLPFEEEFYSHEKIKVEFVGHPILDIIETFPSEEVMSEKVAILPGSRQQEVKRHLPLMLDAASLMRKERPRLFFVVLLAPSIAPSEIAGIPLPEGVRIIHRFGVSFFIANSKSK